MLVFRETRGFLNRQLLRFFLFLYIFMSKKWFWYLPFSPSLSRLGTTVYWISLSLHRIKIQEVFPGHASADKLMIFFSEQKKSKKKKGTTRVKQRPSHPTIPGDNN